MAQKASLASTMVPSGAAWLTMVCWRTVFISVSASARAICSRSCVRTRSVMSISTAMKPLHSPASSRSGTSSIDTQ